jgi:hypothetical protein
MMRICLAAALALLAPVAAHADAVTITFTGVIAGRGTVEHEPNWVARYDFSNINNRPGDLLDFVFAFVPADIPANPPANIPFLYPRTSYPAQFGPYPASVDFSSHLIGVTILLGFHPVLLETFVSSTDPVFPMDHSFIYTVNPLTDNLPGGFGGNSFLTNGIGALVPRTVSVSGVPAPDIATGLLGAIAAGVVLVCAWSTHTRRRARRA